MSKQYKTDYIALQNLWFICSQAYIEAYFDGDMERCFSIINVYRDTLIDITPLNEKNKDEQWKKAIRFKYEKWESEYWIPYCKTKLAEWIKYNSFESKVEDNRRREFENIKKEYNHLRYRKIMQIIQDSGIGLGQGSGGGKGFNVGPKDPGKFTG